MIYRDCVLIVYTHFKISSLTTHTHTHQVAVGNDAVGLVGLMDVDARAHTYTHAQISDDDMAVGEGDEAVGVVGLMDVDTRARIHTHTQHTHARTGIR